MMSTRELSGEPGQAPNCLEQVQVADELGFSNVWVVEHHFMEGLSHLSGA